MVCDKFYVGFCVEITVQFDYSSSLMPGQTIDVNPYGPYLYHISKFCPSKNLTILRPTQSIHVFLSEFGNADQIDQRFDRKCQFLLSCRERLTESTTCY